MVLNICSLILPFVMLVGTLLQVLAICRHRGGVDKSPCSRTMYVLLHGVLEHTLKRQRKKNSTLLAFNTQVRENSTGQSVPWLHRLILSNTIIGSLCSFIKMVLILGKV